MLVARTKPIVENTYLNLDGMRHVILHLTTVDKFPYYHVFHLDYLPTLHDYIDLFFVEEY